MVKNCTVFDSMLMERMGMNNCDTIQYLLECYHRGQKEQGSAINIQLGHNQEFIKYSLEIITNFLELNITTPEMFPDSVLGKQLEE